MTRRWCRSRCVSPIVSLASAVYPRVRGLPGGAAGHRMRARRGRRKGGSAMLISEKLEAALNRQVGREMGASMQYLAIAAYFDGQALKQLARFFYRQADEEDRKSTRLNSSHGYISYAVFCLKKKKKQN